MSQEVKQSIHLLISYFVSKPGGALLKTQSLVEFYEQNYRKSRQRLSDFMSSPMNRRSQQQVRVVSSC